MKDKLGQDIRPWDFVLVAHVGPYLNFGRVHALVLSPREHLDIHEAYQPENDPKKPFICRRRSIASMHRVIRLNSTDGIPDEAFQVIIGGPPQQNAHYDSSHARP